MVSGAVAAGTWISAHAGAIAATAGAVGAVGTVGSGYASYQSGKKKSKQQKQEIARQRGVAEGKKKSLIRQQRNQLGGKGDYKISSSGSAPSGLTAQGEETLG
jgi:hypothetical protein